MSCQKLRCALDLGTTTLGGRLLDAKGACLAEARQLNPQIELGPDVVRRLEAARQGGGERLQHLLVGGIADVVAELLRQAGAKSRSLGAVAAAGNPAITHLLRRLPVDRLLFPPHRPQESRGVDLDPAELGLDLPVPLYLFPLVSGYVGGDLVAFLYGALEDVAAFRPAGAPCLFLDVGTNGELALFDGSRWWTTSVAAGPAFEGGGISCGMEVAPGAVAGVTVRDDSLRLEVVDGGPPRGVCGSGLVAAVAAARDGGLIDATGRILDPGEVSTNLSRYLVSGPGGAILRLYRDAEREILLTQEDVRSFQLAKGAVRAGVECLLGRAGLETEQLGRVVVTGAFGLSLEPAALKRVALLPSAMVDKVRFIPGGALAGICRLLREAEGPSRVQKLADRLQAYPLSGTPAFEKAFLSALDF